MDIGISIDKRNIIMYCAYILVNLYYGISDSMYNSGSAFFLLLAGLGLTFVHIIVSGKYNKKSILVIFVLFAIFGFNYYKTKDSRILTTLITVVGLKDLKLTNILKVIFYERILITLFVMGTSILGFGKNFQFERELVMGFIHGNLLMMTFSIIMMLYFCIYWKNVNEKTLILFTVFTALAYIITDSRTGLVTQCCLLLLVFLYKYFRIEKMLEFLGKYLPFILMFSSLYFPLSIQYGWYGILDKIPGATSIYISVLNAIDKLLSHRFTLTRLIISHSEIGLFRCVKDEEALAIYKYQVVDSGYVQLLLVFGIIGSLAFLILNYMMVKKLIIEKQYIYIICVIIMCLYAFTENSFCSLKYNFTLLFCVQLFHKNMLYEIMQIIKGKKKYRLIPLKFER